VRSRPAGQESLLGVKPTARQVISALILLIAGCAPLISPPRHPLEEHGDVPWRSFTLGDIITYGRYGQLNLVGDLEVVTGTETERFDAVLNIEERGTGYLRLYRFGVVVLDAVITDGVLSAVGNLSDRDTFAHMIPDFLSVFFWWPRFASAELRHDTDGPLLVAGRDVLKLHGPTLTPLSQTIAGGRHPLRVTYKAPRRFGDKWFPAKITAERSSYRVNLAIRKAEFGRHSP